MSMNKTLLAAAAAAEITPHTLVEDEVEVIAQRTLTVATIGKPGDETLRVFSNQMSSNVHTSSNTTETTGEKNNFSWVARSTEYFAVRIFIKICFYIREVIIIGINSGLSVNYLITKEINCMST